MLIEAADAKTVLQFFSAKKYDGTNGLAALKNSLMSDLNIGVWYSELPGDIWYGEQRYDAPAKGVVEEYNEIHHNKLFYKAFELPPPNDDASKKYKCDRSYHGTRSCSDKLCWYYMEIPNLIKDGLLKPTKSPCTSVYFKCNLG